MCHFWRATKSATCKRVCTIIDETCCFRHRAFAKHSCFASVLGTQNPVFFCKRLCVRGRLARGLGNTTAGACHRRRPPGVGPITPARNYGTRAYRCRFEFGDFDVIQRSVATRCELVKGSFFAEPQTMQNTHFGTLGLGGASQRWFVVA